MELVNLNYIKQDAVAKKYGVIGAGNWDQFSTMVFIEAATETRSPIILIIDVPTILNLGIKPFVQVVKAYAEQSDVPIVLNLEEGQDPKIIFECILAGFTSVMFDGAGLGLDLDENIKQTKEIVKFAHYMGVTVEASLGKMPLTIGGVTTNLAETMEKTKLEDAIKFCKETGIDMLAPSIGNYHGCYKEKWPNPDFKLAKKIYEHTGVVMSAHGSTGISKEQIIEGIDSGFVKFCIGTKYHVFFKERLKEYIDKFEGYPAAFNIVWSAMKDLKILFKNQIINDFKSANRY
ncbi:MAG: class II fructose-bisphosphate aldolase [Cyanobacteria bacterium]|nr:class II fructose-bisphosphate aldolase [Cyanobacteriota bacterium]